MEYILYQRFLKSSRFCVASATLLLFFFYNLTLNGYAQTLYNATGEQIWVSEGAIVTVNGTLVNQGFVSNNGHVTVTGDWLNEGVYNAGKGKVIFKGVQEQSINHNSQNIAVLQFEGTGEKLLESELVVLDSLILTNGIVTTVAENPLFLEATVKVDGGNPDSFVNGPLIYKGTGYRYFPVGKQNDFRPIELLDVQGVNPVLSVEVHEPNNSATPEEKLESVSQVRYWEVKPLDGMYEGSLVSLAVGSDEGFSDLLGVVVTGSAQMGGVFENFGQSELSGDVTEGKVTSAEATAYPYLALGITTEFSARNRILVPSAFAPNAPDAENRTLKVYATNILSEGFVFKIFNRWGILVYETTSVDEALNQGWNGVDHKTNEPAQFGVYTYYLSVRFDNNLPVEQTGSITLFR